MIEEMVLLKYTEPWELQCFDSVTRKYLITKNITTLIIKSYNIGMWILKWQPF